MAVVMAMVVGVTLEVAAANRKAVERVLVAVVERVAMAVAVAVAVAVGRGAAALGAAAVAVAAAGAVRAVGVRAK